jgi:hypothetical protein
VDGWCTVILVTGGMEIIAIINCCGTKCLTELIKWDAVLLLFNDCTVTAVTQCFKSGTKSFQ